MNDYTPKDALKILLTKLEAASPILFQRITEAINAGKDEFIEEPLEFGERPKRKLRYYRKHMPYTDAEALKVSLDVLEAHLIETRKFLRAAQDEFTKAETRGNEEAGEWRRLPIGQPPRKEPILKAGEFKPMVIEAEAESVKEKKKLEDVRLETVGSREIATLEELFRALRDLTTFKK